MDNILPGNTSHTPQMSPRERPCFAGSRIHKTRQSRLWLYVLMYSSSQQIEQAVSSSSAASLGKQAGQPDSGRQLRVSLHNTAALLLLLPPNAIKLTIARTHIPPTCVSHTMPAQKHSKPYAMNPIPVTPSPYLSIFIIIRQHISRHHAGHTYERCGQWCSHGVGHHRPTWSTWQPRG